MEEKYQLEVKNPYLYEWFIGSYIGFTPSSEVIDNDCIRNDEVSYHRQGQLVSAMSKFLIRGNSNILCHRKDFYQPVTLKEFQEALGVSKRTFNTFKKDMCSLGRIRIIGETIYVNPVFFIAFDMDYLRPELKEIFPQESEHIDTINKFLKGEYGTRE